MQLGQPVIGNQREHVVFHVEVHVPVEKPIDDIHLNGTAIQPVVEDILGQPRVLGESVDRHQPRAEDLRQANQKQWQDVDPIDQAIVLNSGDLLERWTNGRYTSTLHRVVPKIGARDRLSVVMFLDPDSSTQVSALESCVDEANPPRQPPITAGEHLQQKLDASHKDRYI